MELLDILSEKQLDNGEARSFH